MILEKRIHFHLRNALANGTADRLHVVLIPIVALLLYRNNAIKLQKAQIHSFITEKLVIEYLATDIRKNKRKAIFKTRQLFSGSPQ